MKKIYLLAILLIFTLIFAHQPRLVENKITTVKNPIIVQNPEISQAFYGELKGEPDYYKIDSDKEFYLYLSLVVPDVQGARKDFSVDIKFKDTLIVLDAKSAKWDIFFEKFAGDNYFNGPEFDKKVEAGSYLIKVYNPDNQGKYSLAIGKIEAFPPKEAFHAVVSLPKLKSFFQKSPLTAYFNFIGLFIGITIVFLAIIIVLIIVIFRAIKRKSKNKRI
jgi:hypothetical protein